MLIKAGKTSFTGFRIRILDATTGVPYTGATSATAGASFGYTRPGGTRQSISLSDLAAVDSAYSAGGIKHIGAGWYRLDLPDAALAVGVDSVLIDGSFTAYVVVTPEIQLVGYDPRTELTTAALANLDAPISDLPTNAELATSQAAADDATLAAIAALPTAAGIWAYATRTLTQSAASVAAAVEGSTLTIQRGDTLSASITGLGSIAGRTKLWLTVKGDPQSEADSASVLQLTEAGGLLYLNGASYATPANGSITVTNETTGALTVALAAVVTAALAGGAVYSYDIQILTASGVRTVSSGECRVTTDVTRSTS